MSVFRNDIFAGQVALVTGGGTGIGAGISRALAAHGAKVAVLGRRPEPLAALVAELGDGRGLAVPADVRDPEAVRHAVDTVVEQLGGLSIVVNGAAGNFLCPAAQLSSNGFRTVLDIDAVGTFNVSRAAFDATLSKHGGSIINISATLHYGATQMQVHAASAKAAVDATTRTMAAEWGPAGIRVNAIAPGPIEDTEGVARLLPPGMKDRLVRAIPLRRLGRVQEIADVAVYLASDAASLLTGAIVVADGGAWLGGGAMAQLADHP